MLAHRSQLAAFAFAAAMATVMLPIACGSNNNQTTVQTSQSTSGAGASTASHTSADINGSSAITFMSGPMTTGVGGANASTGAGANGSTSGVGGMGMAVHKWDAAYGGNGQNDSVAVFGSAVDKNGNVFVAGSFHGTINFGGGQPPVSSTGNNDVFIAKYDKQGQLVWRKGVGSGQDAGAHAVAVDSNGRVVVVGQFKGSMNMGGNQLSCEDFQFPSAWAAVFDNDGNHIASQRFGSGPTVKGANNDGDAVAFDPTGNVVILGTFQSQISFDNDQSYVTAAGGLGNYNMYVAKLIPNAGSKDFQLISAKGYGSGQSNNGAYGTRVAVFSNGDVAIGGFTTQPINFGGGNLNPPAVDPVPQQAVVARLDGNFTQKFAKMFPSQGDATVQGLAFHSNGDLVVGGTFQNGIDVGAGTMKPQSSADNQYVARFDSTGKLAWGVHFGGVTGSDELNFLAIDSNGYPVWGGSFQDSETVNQTKLTSKGGRDGLVVKLGPDDGHGYWAYGFGDPQLQEVRGIAVDASNNTVFAGNFRGTIDLGGGPRTAPAGAQWFFIAGFGP